MDKLASSEIKPPKLILHYKAPKVFLKAIADRQLNFGVVPPHNY